MDPVVSVICAETESMFKTGRGKVDTTFFFDLQETNKSNANSIKGYIVFFIFSFMNADD
jgi:hypothetical protein